MRTLGNVHTIHLIIVFALVAAVFAAFLTEWLLPDLVALSAMAVLLATGVLTTDEALSVLSNSAPVVIASMFVLSAALERTGAIDALARVFMRMAGENEMRALLALAALTLPLSALINHAPVVVFLPVVLALARHTDTKASRLLIETALTAHLVRSVDRCDSSVLEKCCKELHDRFGNATHDHSVRNRGSRLRSRTREQSLENRASAQFSPSIAAEV